MTVEGQPVVSILLITYNHEKYILQALNSILAQKTTFSMEILVGDDCSTDQTPQIILSVAEHDPRVIPIIRSANLGATQNVYDLQMRASGKYVAYLEGDDYWCDEEKLQKQVDFLDSNPEFIACTHTCILVNEDGEAYRNQHLHWITEKEFYSIQDFHGIVLPGHGNTLVHRNIFLDSFDKYRNIITIHPMIGDRSLALLLASQGDIRKMPEAMSCYRMAIGRENSATETIYHNNKNKVQDDYQFTKALESYAKEILKVDGGFVDHKAELFVSALWAVVRSPSSENLRFLRQMLREGKPLLYWGRVPKVVVQKFLDRVKARR